MRPPPLGWSTAGGTTRLDLKQAYLERFAGVDSSKNSKSFGVFRSIWG
jgi:hypothetical protein